MRLYLLIVVGGLALFAALQTMPDGGPCSDTSGSIARLLGRRATAD